MVSLPLTAPTPRSGGLAGKTRFGRLLAHVGGFFEILGAAIRVSQAVQSRQDADRADLLTLGIDRPLPRSW